jgi:heme/copper-type cytochrome/quinol oxidase subunit 2
MPLSEKVTFTAALQSRSTIQIPKSVRWRFKLETGQLLKVGVNFLGLHRGWQFFYGKMRKDGRLAIPKMVIVLFQIESKSLAGCALEVMLEPA